MSKPPITAKHWLPSFKEEWDAEGDLRARLMARISDIADDPPSETPKIMDPDKPDPVKVIGANWIHADVHGIMTEEIFYEDLEKTLQELADTIVREQNPWQPVRIYKDAQPAYGVGFFDWRGDEFPFDLRVVSQFGKWEFTTDKNEKVVSAGFRFWISTLVLPTEHDVDIYVGRDPAKAFDAGEIGF